MTSMLKYVSFTIFVLVAITSCKIYKFTGASIPPEVNTISIGNFPNLAPIQAPALSDIFVDKLQDKIVGGTRLKLANANTGDVILSGSIKDYYVNPATISGQEETEQNRLTIVIQVDYVNVVVPEQSFSQTFSDGENFDANQNLSDVEDDLINIITDRIAENIFNKAFVNW
ncbi:MAG: LptE family protein [Chitinophagales bacterium]